jgi:16S rRNA (guanine1207-N2)-methyltransferase
MSAPLATLLLPFEQGVLRPPEAPVLFYNAQVGAALGPEWRARLHCLQPLKPAADTLTLAGFQVVEEVTTPTPLAMLLISPHKRETRARMAEALAALQPGGTLVVAGENAAGPRSYEKALAAELPLDGVLSRGHARVFWARRPDTGVPPGLQAWLAEGEDRAVAEGRFLTRAGLFSADGIDAASALLVQHMPAGMRGVVADVGAGWGFLAAEALLRCGGITALELYEADRRGLELSARNLARVRAAATGTDDLPPRIGLHWVDVTHGIGKARHDWVLMNPPFHDGKAEDASLGQRFIAAAATSLKPNGRLLMVANRHLPYAAVLAKHFRRVEALAEDARFRVTLAVR